MDEVFDSALQETAQRLLPLAVVDIVGREDDGVTQRLGAIREHDEFFTYIVRDADGRILLQSHAADPAMFPAYDGPGFARPRPTALQRRRAAGQRPDHGRRTAGAPRRCRARDPDGAWACRF